MRLLDHPNKALDTEQPGRLLWGATFPSSSQDKTFQEKAEETQHRQLQGTHSPEVFSSLIQSGFWLIQALEFLARLFSLRCVCGHYPYKCHYHVLF